MVAEADLNFKLPVASELLFSKRIERGVIIKFDLKLSVLFLSIFYFCINIFAYLF